MIKRRKNLEFREEQSSVNNLDSRKIKHHLKFILGIEFGFTVLAIIVYHNHLGDLYHLVSFRWNDQPWMPPKIDAKAIFLEHYFGDFQLSTAWSRLNNPYTLDLELTFGLIPSALIVLKVFTLLDIRISYILFVCLNIFLVFSFTKLFYGQKNSRNRIFSILIILMSSPFLIILDRGNFVGIAFFSYAIFTLIELGSKKGDNWKLSQQILFSVAVSLKYYLLIPSLLLFFATRKRRILAYLFWLTLLNLVMSIAIPGNILTVVKNIFLGAADQLGANNPSWLLGGVGPNQFVAQIYAEYLCKNEINSCLQSFSKFSILPLVAWTLIGYILIKNKPQNIWLFLYLISSLQFLPAVAMKYTAIWQVFSLIILANCEWDNTVIKKLHIFILYFTVISIGIMPIFIRNLSFPFNDSRQLSFVIGTIVYAFVVYAGFTNPRIKWADSFKSDQLKSII